MSQLLKKIVQDWEAQRIFRRRIFRSKRDPSVEYETTIYWGGTMELPNVHCTCPLATFQSKLCRHALEMWNDLDSFAKQNVIHHDEIVAKPWWRGAGS
jgi:hypothetical protein